MNNVFAIAYSKYCIALEKNEVTDELRNGIIENFKKENDYHKREVYELLFNLLISKSSVKFSKEFLKSECIALELDKFALPENPELFDSILEYCMMDYNGDADLFIETIRNLYESLEGQVEGFSGFLQGIYNLLLRRLLKIYDKGTSLLVKDSDLTSAIIEKIESFGNTDKIMNLIVWND